MKRAFLVAACALLAAAASTAGGAKKEDAKQATSSIRTETKLVPGGVDVTCMCSGGKTATKRCDICNHECDCGADGGTPTVTCTQVSWPPSKR